MDLSPRDIRFLIEAINVQQYQFSLSSKSGQLSEDDTADLSNDTMYLEELKKDLQAHHDGLIRAARPATDAT